MALDKRQEVVVSRQMEVHGHRMSEVKRRRRQTQALGGGQGFRVLAQVQNALGRKLEGFDPGSIASFRGLRVAELERAQQMAEMVRQVIVREQSLELRAWIG